MHKNFHRERIKIAMAAISKQKRLAWILLLGDKAAGKTTLLANSNLTAVIKNDQTVDWWVGKEAVFIDPPGQYDKASWECILHILKKKKRGKQLFEKIIWVIDAPALLTLNTEDKDLVFDFQQQLQMLATVHRLLPITIVITHCDRLSGFIEFFADLSPEERSQPLGFSLTSNEKNLPTKVLFQQRATDFVKLLGKRLLTRLHHEQNLTRRARIKDFPLQMEQLNQSLEKIITKLPWDFPIQLEGVYYTSSSQNGTPVNALTKSISGALRLIDIKTVETVLRNKAYFVQGLFQQLVTRQPMRPTHSRTHWSQLPQLTVYFILLIAVLTGSWYLHSIYQKEKTVLTAVRAQLTPNNQSPKHPLYILSEARDLLQRKDLSRDSWVGLGESVKLRLSLQRAYQKLLTALLQKESASQVALEILQSQYPQQQPLFPNNLPGFDVSRAIIPVLYSNENRDTIYNIKIPKIAALLVKEGEHNEVLLTQQIRTLYLQQANTAWQFALNQIRLLPPQQFSDIQNDIKILSDAESPLWQVLQKSPMQQNMQPSLHALGSYISNMMQSSLTTKAILINAAKRMQAPTEDDPITNSLQLAQKLPAPMNQWIQILGNGTWHLMLDNARDYMNTIWKTSVLNEYQDNIANHYPIFRESKQDITQYAFNHFFGPGGTLQNFFNDYLKPFVNTNQAYWTWKKQDDEALGIPQSTLDMIIRASMIQKMFYTNDPSNPSVKFTLTPINLSPNVRRFVLNIGGQMVDNTLGDNGTTDSITWPGEDGDFVTMRFTALSPDKPTQTLQGFWAWFHLVDQSRLQTTNDPKTFQITFGLHDNQATYQLKADNAVNPYQPQLLSSFRCPDKL